MNRMVLFFSFCADGGSIVTNDDDDGDEKTKFINLINKYGQKDRKEREMIRSETRG